VEQDRQNEGGNSSMQSQLGHRNDDAELKNADAVTSMQEVPGDGRTHFPHKVSNSAQQLPKECAKSTDVSKGKFCPPNQTA